MSVKIDKKDLKSNQFKKEWSTIKLKDICEKGKEKNKNTTIDIVFSNSALNGIVEQSSFFYKDIANRENLSTYFIVNKDDFVYNPRISSLAPCGPINRNKSGKKGVVSPLYTVFNLKNNKCELDYLEHYFKSSCWYKYMYSIANYGARSDRMNVTDSDFFNMELSLPPIEEQQKIASILSTWDKAIELKEKLIEQKKEQKKGLMQKLLTGEVRLPGFDGEWEEYEVQEICSLGRGRVISKKEIAKNIGTYPVYSSQTSDEGKIGSINTYDFDGEYITWTTDGANAGTVFYRNGKFNCTNVCGILKLNKDNIDARYLSYILQANTDKYVVRHGNPKLMNNIMAIIPVRIFNNYNYQKYICDLFDVLDKEIKLFEKEVKEIKHQKQGLMQQLLTGKIRVKV